MSGGDAPQGDNPQESAVPPPPPPAELIPQAKAAEGNSVITEGVAGAAATKAPSPFDDEDDESDFEELGMMPKYQVAILATSVAVVAAAAVAVFLQVPLETINKFTSEVPKIAQAIPVAIALYVLVDYLSALALDWARNSGLDMTMAAFIRGTVKYGISLVALISILGTLGIQTNGLTAAVTSIGLSVGLASQKVLGNLAAGLMLLILRPFKKGDFVILGGKTMGVVHAISLFATQVDTINNVRIAVPNSEVYGTVVENYSKHRMRLVEVEVCTAPSGGVAEARRVIEQAIAKYAKYQDEEMMLRRIIKRRNLAAQGIVKPSTRQPALSPPPSKPGANATASGNSSAPAKPGASSNQGVPARGVFDEFKTLLQWQKTNTEIDLNDLGLDPQGKSPPKVWMKSMTQQGYNWLVRVWVPGSQFESIKFSMTEDIASALRKAKIRTNADVLELKYLPKKELEQIVGPS